MRSARVPSSSTAWHHAACPMQMKWLSNFSALSTPLRTNLPARLKLSFLCSSLTFVLPWAAWGWEQSPRLLWAHGSPGAAGAQPHAAAPCQWDLVQPGNPWCWPGLAVPQCHHWGSAPQPPEPCSAVLQPSPAGTVTSTSTVLRRVLAGWEVPLDAAAGCSAYIRWLLIALKIFKD